MVRYIIQKAIVVVKYYMRYFLKGGGSGHERSNLCPRLLVQMNRRCMG